MIRARRREVAVALALALVLGVLAWAAPGFYRPGPLADLAVRIAPVLVAALGMTLVIICRQIDISVGSVASASALAAGLLARAGLPIPLVALAAVAVGGALGAVNGWLVAGLGLPSIVATLATLVILRESIRFAQEGEAVRDLPADFQWFGLGQGGGQGVVVLVALVALVGFAWGMRHLRAGRAVYATGSDREAARLAGVRPDRVVFWVFVLMGALAGLSSLLVAVPLPVVEPNAGQGLEMKVIAAAVVGGSAISGGRGTMVGTLLGVVLLGLVNPALGFLHASPEWEKAIQGGIILLAVASDGLGRGDRS